MDNLIKDTNPLENFTYKKQAKKKMIIIGIALILIIILVLFLIIFLSSPKKIFGLIDISLWEYNEEDKVYYQLQIQYCTNPKNNLSEFRNFHSFKLYKM